MINVDADDETIGRVHGPNVAQAFGLTPVGPAEIQIAIAVEGHPYGPTDQSSPRSASEVQFREPLPMMMWSWSAMSNSRAQSASWRVSRMSSRLGVGSPPMQS